MQNEGTVRFTLETILGASPAWDAAICTIYQAFISHLFVENFTDPNVLNVRRDQFLALLKIVSGHKVVAMEFKHQRIQRIEVMAERHIPRGDRNSRDQLVRLHHLMRWTLRAFYWLDESLQNLIEEAGWSRFSHTQTMVILAIGEGITRSADLGRILGISRQAIHQVINELIREGLVVISDDPSDKRSKVLGFNQEAVKLRQFTYSAVENIERELAKRLGKKVFKGILDGMSADWGNPIQPLKAKRSESAKVKTQRRATNITD